MTRINVYRVDEFDGKVLDGWFDTSKAEKIDEDTRWDGNDYISVHGPKFTHQALYRTVGGRWVLNRWSQWQGSEDTWEFIGDEQAKTWLATNNSDDVIAKHFGELEAERGPGRPEVGKPINVRLGDELLARVDAEAAARGTTRAVTIRDLVAQALGATVAA